MERDDLKARGTKRDERDRREADLYMDLRASIARTRELTRRSKDLLVALSAEPRSFRRED